MKLLKTLLRFKPFYYLLALLSIIYSLIRYCTLDYSDRYFGSFDLNCNIVNYSIDGNKLTMELKCPDKFISYYYINSVEEKNYLLDNLSFNKNVSISGDYIPISNNTFFYGFNYKRYYFMKGIKSYLSITSMSLLESGSSVFYNLKNYLYSRVKKTQNEYLYAFILGNSKYLDEEEINNFRNNGVSHLLALSGMHISVFSVSLLFILKKFKVNINVRYILVIIIFCLLYFVSSQSVSLLRALLFFIFSFIYERLNIDIGKIYILFLCFSLILFINPFYLYNSGFLLSFTNVFFLISFSKKNKSYILSLLFVSIISFLSTLGLCIYFFGQVNYLSILFNIILVPLVSIIIFPLCIITFIFPFINEILLFFLTILKNLNSVFSSMGSVIYFPYIPFIFVIIYNTLLFIALKKKKELFLLVFILVVIFKMHPYFDNSYRIYFLDVGQGDSALLVSNYLKGITLIDTGGKVSYSNKEKELKSKEYSISLNKTIPFLRKIGINKISFLIITHGDYDHMGEAINLVNNFKVEKVIFNCGPYNDLEKELIKVLDEKKIKYYSCIKELNIDKKRLYFLQTKKYDNENDNSNVIYTELNGYKFMFMGDAGVEKEKDILEKYKISTVDVLKVGHHGSKTSSIKTFIDVINPKYSIISVGKNNRYGHPNKEVLYNLKDSKIYRTDEDGSIMFKLKSNKLKIKTCGP